MNFNEESVTYSCSDLSLNNNNNNNNNQTTKLETDKLIQKKLEYNNNNQISKLNPSLNKFW